MSPRAVLFDFGGTLFSYRSVQGAAFHPLLREALTRLRVAPEARAVGRAWRRASGDAFRAFHERPYYLHKDLFQDTFRRFAALLGGEARADDLEWFHDAQRDLVVQGFELRAGLRRDAPRAARRRAPRRDRLEHRRRLPAADARARRARPAPRRLDELRGRALVQAPRGDLRARPRLAGASPGEAVFVGDSPEHDIAGARRLGIRTILIRDGELENPGAGAGEAGTPDHVIEDLREIPALLGLG